MGWKKRIAAKMYPAWAARQCFQCSRSRQNTMPASANALEGDGAWGPGTWPWHRASWGWQRAWGAANQPMRTPRCLPSSPGLAASSPSPSWEPPVKKQTRITHMIWFLSCVDSKVTFEGLQVPEACATDLAGVRLLPSVNEHVSTEVGHLERTALGEDGPRD